jgi:predicted nucleic acid-binding protein
LIVVDSSVWIDFFNGKVTRLTDTLLSLIGYEPLLVGDIILCEILQGARTEAQARELEGELRKFEVAAMFSPELAVVAAKNYRILRGEGITIRKTIDLLIGTFCIAHEHVLLHDDRDFAPMETHLGLKATVNLRRPEG